MAYQIETRYEKKRGCGYRQKGGLYFVSGRSSAPCGKLPIEVSICPCCGQGIQFSRGFTWVSAQLVREAPCSQANCNGCYPFSSTLSRYGLMWVGQKFYKTPDHFDKEANEQGISKRLPGFVPTDFTVGVDWILLAHLATPFPDETHGIVLKPAIFRAFCPERIEYVITGNETDEELQAKIDKGITLVDVRKWEERPKEEAPLNVPLLNLY